MLYNLWSTDKLFLPIIILIVMKIAVTDVVQKISKK